MVNMRSQKEYRIKSYNNYSNKVHSLSKLDEEKYIGRLLTTLRQKPNGRKLNRRKAMRLNWGF
jgi:hypothetical protein